MNEFFCARFDHTMMRNRARPGLGCILADRRPIIAHSTSLKMPSKTTSRRSRESLLSSAINVVVIIASLLIIVPIKPTQCQYLFQQQQQQQQPKAARQLFMSDFVSNQSQKLLKNFVNNTLADLVARQPINGGSGLARFIHANNNNRPFGQEQQPLVDVGEFQLASKPERPYLPAIGKLYSFLFPNQAQQQQQQQQIQQPRVRHLFGSGDEPIEPSSSNSMDFYESAAEFGNRETANATKITGKLVSLTAPYESNQARELLLKVNELPTFDLASNESSWRKDKLNETLVAYPDDQEQQPSSEKSFAGADREHDEPKPVAMTQEDSHQPEIAQSVEHADEEDQMNMDSDSSYQSGEFKFLEEQQNAASNPSFGYQPHEFDHQEKRPHNHSSGLFNHQMEDDSNESTTSSNAAESFLHHLPSSYDSPLRVPPEGYYDDYYKLASSSQTTGFQAPLMESLLPDQQHQHMATNHHNHQADELMAMINDTRSELPSRSNSSSSKPINSSEQDNIQLILANTNSSIDPINNEKVINYISEGQNVTFQPASGKSPRHTFVNKDMNELPPATPDRNAADYPRSNSSYGDGIPLQVSDSQVTSTTTPSSYIGNNGELYPRGYFPVGEFYKPSREFKSVDDNNNNNNSNSKQSRRATTESPLTVANENDAHDGVPNYASRIDYDTEPHLNTADRSIDDDGDDAETQKRLSLDTGQNFGQYNRDSGKRPATESSPKNKPRKSNDESARGSVKKRVRGQHEGGSNRKRRQHNMRQQQTTIRRPQVTQAHFDPKDLIMSKPTPQPSVTETAMETITELPSKVKKLRENPPDKNELMNELLTALDRVKVAIYKLQPLTAKMNAIYRKSVTSNTRDTVLDNNKGTYAKRYPPGDYDDSYDRIHPSELLVTRSNPTASSRKGRRTPRTSPSRHPRRMMADDEIAEESATSATYLPAPRHMVEASLNNSSSQRTAVPVKIELESDSEELELSNEIVATGIGRRMGDGRLEGEVVSFGSVGDDEDLRQKLADQFVGSPQGSSANDSTVAVIADLDPSQTFGYRITIYRSPDDNDDDDMVEDQQQQSASGADEISSASERLSYSLGGSDEQDFMTTSESSLVESVSDPNRINGTSAKGHTGSDPDEGDLRADESKEKEKKKDSEKWEKKKEKKEKEGKKQEKSQKSQEKKKKGDEESKKKKEYKKIKHNKGLISKESKKMHRDKHIKAHDRGAAKEKALKERTQIEFFEREQIVDDEYEKGKKSTMKAGWQSGHEAKKSMKDISGGMGGDSMSMGGSHFVAHEQPASFSEKGHGSSVESSSGKKSNKFEKKDMESKGKKFKGWREKGYKIVTETEFIDRGSLHDSAYKKRDKGAAHHKKYKKQEASSEGHHGSMQEHHKKSHKKEEKKEKMQEKQMKKGEGGEEKKEKGEKKKKQMMEKDKKEEADEEESMLAATIRPSDEIIEAMNRNQRSRQPISVETGAWHFSANDQNQQQSAPALLRLLNAEHDLKSVRSPQQRSNSESNAGALLDIVDNSTGQRINKTRVGTYEVDDQTAKPIAGDPKQQQRPSQSFNTKFLAPDHRTSRQSLSIGTQPQPQPQTNDTTSTRPNPKQAKPEPVLGDRSDRAMHLQKFMNLLRAEQIARRQQDESSMGGSLNQFKSMSTNGNTNQQSVALSNNHPPPIIGRQPNSMGIAAAPAFLQQVAQKTSSSAANAINLNNPYDTFDLMGNSFIPSSDHVQTSFLPQAPPLSAHMSASNYRPASYFPPPVDQFEFGSSSRMQPSGILFPSEQLLDYDPDTILAPSSHSNFAID